MFYTDRHAVANPGTADSMTVRYVRPVSHSAYAARRIGLAALVLFVLAVLAHRFGPLRTPDFLALVLMSAAIAAAAVPLALVGLIRLWQKGAEGGMASAKALVYAGVPLGFVAAGAVLYLTRPPLNEVSTDLEDVPAFLSRPQYDQQWLATVTTTRAAERQAQLAAYPGLAGRRYEGALDRVLQGVEAAAISARIDITDRKGVELPELQDALPGQEPQPDDAVAEVGEVPIPLPRPEPALPGMVASLADQDVLLQGETETLVLGLSFDIVIRLREDVETTFVDVRVASRYGAHDLGMSAEIADDFLDRLDAELLGIAGG
nr:hypothetical protein RKHAN_02563 [Rhizobium sp. Khangiran2]